MLDRSSQAPPAILRDSSRVGCSAARNARESAYRILRDRIIFLDLKPGEALNDKQLSEELRMSRTPVREALIILSTVNMVILKPQAGTFVAPIDVGWVETEQFSRRALEKEVIRQACTGLTEDTAQLYEKNLEDHARAVASSSPDRMRRLLELDNAFHRIAFLAVGQENSFSYMLHNMQHIERLRVLSMLVEDSGQLTDDHGAISRAILAGDETAALYWLNIHLTRYRESLRLTQERFPEYFHLH